MMNFGFRLDCKILGEKWQLALPLPSSTSELTCIADGPSEADLEQSRRLERLVDHQIGNTCMRAESLPLLPSSMRSCSSGTCAAFCATSPSTLAPLHFR